MARRQYFRGPRCDVSNCKSTRYYVADGLTYCHNNHQAHGVLEYQIDEDEAMASGFGSRRKRGPDLETERREKAASKQHHGRLGFATFLQAYQLIMRHQAKFIVARLEVPAFEPLLKKMWHLFLEAQRVSDQLPEDETVDADQPVEEDDVEMTLDSGSESGMSTDTGRAQEYESAYYAMHRPLLIHTVALTYLTLITLRVPITIHDLKTWIDSGEFPYISAIRLVPDDLSLKLESQYHAALDPQLRPRASRIWKWTQQTAIFLKLNSTIEFPDLNYRPVLYNIVKDTLLPLDIYNAVDVQVKNLDLNLNLTTEQKRDTTMSIPPEGRVLCLVLIMAKLFYSLDGVRRSTAARDEPPARGPNLRAWQRAIKLMVSTLQGVDLASKTKPNDVFDMNDTSLDDYLDWYARNWVIAKPTNKYLATPDGILSMFPLQPISSDSGSDTLLPSQNRLETVQWLYSIPRDWTPDGTLQIGEDYQPTSLDASRDDSLWDDLIDLAALQHHMSTRDLRKQIVALEKRIASGHSIGQRNKSKRGPGRPRSMAKAQMSRKSKQTNSTAERDFVVTSNSEESDGSSHHSVSESDTDYDE